MSGIAFLIRETAARGIRVRAGHMGMEVPEGAHQIWTVSRHGHGATPGEDGKLVEGRRNVGPIEVLVPRLSGTVANGRPFMWWVLERKVGEEMVAKKSKGQTIEVPVGIYAPDWQEAAGTMLDVMKSMAWVYENGVIGEAFAPRAEWLACSVCDEAQLLPKQAGAATAKRKCHMRVNCEGIVRRLPTIFEVTGPKAPPKPKAPAVPKPTPAATPGAERFKKRVTKTTTVEEWIADPDEEYDESSVDREVA